MMRRLPVLLLVVALANCKAAERATESSEASAPPPSSTAAMPASSAIADASEEDSSIAALRSAASLSEAIAAAKRIKNKSRTASTRALLLAHWSRSHLTWQELVVKDPETSFGMAIKDVDEAMGKRFCVTARVDVIQALSGEPKVYVAQLTTNQGHYALITPRSTGKIVAPNNARFCAFVADVTRLEDSDGALPVVTAVGAFDLPENKN